MKSKILILVLSMALLGACKKEQTVQPVQPTPVAKDTTTHYITAIIEIDSSYQYNFSMQSYGSIVLNKPNVVYTFTQSSDPNIFLTTWVFKVNIGDTIKTDFESKENSGQKPLIQIKIKEYNLTIDSLKTRADSLGMMYIVKLI